MHIIGLINEILYKNVGFKVKVVKNIKYQPKDYLWFEREEFDKRYNKIKEHTLVDKERCYMLYEFLRYAIALDGEVAEVGVYKGGTGKLIAITAVLRKKTVHLFDTFSGLPKTNSNKDTYWQEGKFSDVSFDAVKQYFSELNNVMFYKGLFPDTADSIKDKYFCFVHIDVDIYQSALDCLEFFYKRLIKGAIMIFDDYGFAGSEGLKKAVDEFSLENDISPIYLPTGQGLIINKL